MEAIKQVSERISDPPPDPSDRRFEIQEFSRVKQIHFKYSSDDGDDASGLRGTKKKRKIVMLNFKFSLNSQAVCMA